MSDEQVVELLSYNKIKNSLKTLFSNKKELKEEIIQRLNNNENLWTEGKSAKTLEAVMILHSDISQLREKFEGTLKNFLINRPAISVHEIAVLKTFSNIYLPRYSQRLNLAFKQEFSKVLDWSVFSLNEFLLLSQALSSGNLVEKSEEDLPPNIKSFFEGLINALDNEFYSIHQMIPEILYRLFNIPVPLISPVHQFCSCKLFEHLTKPLHKISQDQALSFIKIIGILKIPEETRSLLLKCYLSKVGKDISLFNRKYPLINIDCLILEKIFTNIAELKLIYPELMINALYLIKSKDSLFRNFSSIIESLAVLNFTEIIESQNVVKNPSSHLMFLKSTVLSEINTIEKLIQNKEFELNSNSRQVFKLFWSCAVFNIKPDLGVFVNYLNTKLIYSSTEIIEKYIQVNNWLKHELKTNYNLKVPYEISLSQEMSQEKQYYTDFKKAVSPLFNTAYVQDFKENGILIDFADPEKKHAVFLESQHYFIFFNNRFLPTGEKVLIDRILKELGWTIDMLTISDYLYKKKPYLDRV